MPISFENALLVLKKMKGDTVSKDWQGGGSKVSIYKGVLASDWQLDVR